MQLFHFIGARLLRWKKVRSARPVGTSRDVLLVFPAGRDGVPSVVPAVERLMHSLELVPEVVAFLDQKAREEVPAYSYFDTRSLDIIGRPKGEWLDRLREKPWKYVINLSTHPCAPLDWLVNRLSAEAKVGFWDAPHLYNIVLLGHDQKPDSIPRQLNQILSTLNARVYVNT